MRPFSLTTTAPWTAAPERAPAGTASLQQSWWRLCAWLIIAAMGAAQAWAARQVVSPDGVAYLDLAHAFLRGDWGLAVNRLWSPLYPALLASVLDVLRPAPYEESAVAHGLNLVLLLGALASFEFLLSQLIAYHRTWALKASTEGRAVLPEWSLRMLGYAGFALASFVLVSVATVDPDLCVSLLVYLATGLLLKVRRSPTTGSFLLLGIVLGLGYLAKAPLFPLAFVFLALAASAAYAQLPVRTIVRRLLAALIPFALIAGALVLAFGLTGKGVTLGESGRLNYAWHIDGLPYVHWQGDIPGSGSPAHPSRRLLTSPPVYEFATPVAGTYPPWDDPAYWYEGVRVRFDAGGHLRNMVRSVRLIAGMLLRWQGSLVIGALALLYLGGRGRRVLQDAVPYSMLWIPACAAVGAFSAIWLELRFIAPFVAPFWLGVFAAMTFPQSPNLQRVVGRITMAMLGVLVLTTLAGFAVLAGNIVRWERVNSPLAVAQGLHRLGIHPGDRVGIISDSPGAADASWALPAQVRIVAEMPACRTAAGSVCVAGSPGGPSAFLGADEQLRIRILSVFDGAGADAVIMRDANRTALPGWRPIPDTDYFVYLFKTGGGEP